MRRHEFDHVIVAAADVSGEREIVVIGSQAILGNVDDPPAGMLFSMEADLYPRNDPGKADEIEGSLGEGSQFQSTFGYYAHGVRPETVVGPAGWEERLVRVEIPARVKQSEGAIAFCLEIHDLVLAKCAADRERDWEFAQDALVANLVEVDELFRRLEGLPNRRLIELGFERCWRAPSLGSKRGVSYSAGLGRDQSLLGSRAGERKWIISTLIGVSSVSDVLRLLTRPWMSIRPSRVADSSMTTSCQPSRSTLIGVRLRWLSEGSLNVPPDIALSISAEISSISVEVTPC